MPMTSVTAAQPRGLTLGLPRLMLTVALVVGMVFAASLGLVEIILGGGGSQASGNHDTPPVDPKPDRGPTTTTTTPTDETTTTTTTPPTTQVETTTTTSTSPPTAAAPQTTTTGVTVVIDQTRGQAAGSPTVQETSSPRSPPAPQGQAFQAVPNNRPGTSGGNQAQSPPDAALGPDELAVDVDTGTVMPLAEEPVTPVVPGAPATGAAGDKARSVAAGALPAPDDDRGMSLRIPAPFLIALVVTLALGAVAIWRDRRRNLTG